MGTRAVYPFGDVFWTRRTVFGPVCATSGPGRAPRTISDLAALDRPNVIFMCGFYYHFNNLCFKQTQPTHQ